MRFICIILVSLTLFSTLGGCARKSTPTGKLRINLGAIGEAGPPITAAYIWGFNKTFGLTFGAHLYGNGRELELPLKPGVWNFKVMAWDGANMFEGITRCGGSPDIAFQSGDVDVPIHLNQDGCIHPFVGPDEFRTGNVVKPFRFVSCRSLGAVASDGTYSCPNAYLGVTKSFRVILPSYFPRPAHEVGPFAPESLKSVCFDVTPANTKTTNMHIPVGNDSPESPRVYIEAFDQLGCAGAPKFTPFPFGLKAAQGIEGKILPGPGHSVLFFKHGIAVGGKDFTMFGNGSDGNATWNGNMTQDDSLVKARARKISNLVPNVAAGTSALTVSPTGGAAPFAIQDEIMWHISMERPASGCGANTLQAGDYGFATVTAVSSDIITVDYVFPLLSLAGLQAELRFTNDPSTGVCDLQIIRVPHFDNVNVIGSSIISALSFGLGSGTGIGEGYGGIFPIRIKNKLTINNDVTLTLSADGKGYPWGHVPGGVADFRNFQGVGPGGFTTGYGVTLSCGIGGGVIGCNLPLGMGGGVGTGAAGMAGGGGGGHMGSGGDGKNNGGGGGIMAGKGGMSISPTLAIHMGASGGHGRSATILGASDGGAAGGGIIALYAREIIIGSGTASFTVSARGISGDSSLTNGGGGGAGGSVFAFTQYLNRPFDMNAQGGSGRGGSGGGSGAGGGGGGGGRILLRSCYWGGSAPTFNTQGGAGGPDSPPTGSGSPGGPGYEGDENGTLANILNPAFSFCL